MFAPRSGAAEQKQQQQQPAPAANARQAARACRCRASYNKLCCVSCLDALAFPGWAPDGGHVDVTASEAQTWSNSLSKATESQDSRPILKRPALQEIDASARCSKEKQKGRNRLYTVWQPLPAFGFSIIPGISLTSRPARSAMPHEN